MAFEDEEIQQQELSQNINDNDNSNTDPADNNNNNNPDDNTPPPDVNSKGEVVNIQTKSIQVGTSDFYSPSSYEELNELVSKEIINEKHKNTFVLKYEACELPKTPVAQGVKKTF